MKDLLLLGSATGEFVGDNNDIRVDANGDLVCIDGVTRVKQDVTKILLTERALVPYPNYGSLLPSLPGTRATNPSLLATLADDIIISLRYLTLSETSSVNEEQIGELLSLDLEFQSGAIVVTLSLNTLANTIADLRLEI